MSIRQAIVSQFKKPRGLLGQLAGYVMSKRASNVERNRWLVELLNLKVTDNVLEIGYGPGLALEGVLRTISEGTVVGIDHSDTMLEQASHRISSAIAQGRARLLVGDIETAPVFDGQFDHIFSANVVMFWQNPVEVFRHLKRFLAPGGDVATLFMPRNKGATSGDSLRFGEGIQRWLQQAGFTNIRMEVKEFAGLAAVCIIAS